MQLGLAGLGEEMAEGQGVGRRRHRLALERHRRVRRRSVVVDEKLGRRPAIHRLADRLVDLEARAAGREADREVVAVAGPHAERPVAAAGKLAAAAARRRHFAAVAEQDAAEPVAFVAAVVGDDPAPAASRPPEVALKLVDAGHDRRAVLARLAEQHPPTTGPLGVGLRGGELALDLRGIAATTAAARSAAGPKIVGLDLAAEGRLRRGFAGKAYSHDQRQADRGRPFQSTDEMIERHRTTLLGTIWYAPRLSATSP